LRLMPIVSIAITFGILAGCAGTSHARTFGSQPFSVVSAAGPRLCPPRDNTFQPSADPRTATVLVPGHPTGALACRYWGLDDPGHRVATLAGARSVRDAAAVEHLATRLDALPPYPSGPSPRCPDDPGRSELILFEYRHAAADPVHIELGGCTTVTNGRLVRIGLSLPTGNSHWLDEVLL